MEKTNIKYIIIGIVTTLLIAVLGITFAYFRGTIKGEGAPMTVMLGEVKIIFTDEMDLSSDEVKPGWSKSKTFTIENQSSQVFEYDIYIEDLINTFVTEGGLQYKITSTNNGYNMTDFEDMPKSDEATDTTLAYSISIAGNTTQEYTLEVRYFNDTSKNQSEDMGKKFSGTLTIRKGTSDPNSLYNKILADHPTVNTRTSFDSVLGSSTATTGVIYKEDTYKEDPTTSSANNKDVYYFAGNVADNWVKFAGYYWRIIRTNEDGGIRLLYHGTSTTATDSYIQTNYVYNPAYNNTMYVGYMYGSTGSLANNRNNTTSPQIKTKLESWYSSAIASYDNAVSKTAIYCNDRAGDAYAATETMYYAADKRLYHNKRPTYKCGGSATSTSLYGDANVADRFSKSTASGGNGQLSQPIGLMTADEVAFAGGLWNTNAPNTYYYLNSSGGSSTGSYWWWTMSPWAFNGSRAYVIGVWGSNVPGYLSNASVSDTSAAVRPVLSLKSCVTATNGDGTADSPYEIEVSSSCALKDN